MVRRRIVAAIFAAIFLSVGVSQALGLDLKVATFNIQNFGLTKAKKPEILRYLGQVIRKFDIVAVQEVSDATEVAPRLVLNEINRTGRNYDLRLSPRTGKQPDNRTSQEQYAFYFDTDRVTTADKGRLFADGAHDLFQREPFTAEFDLVGTEFGLTITTIHTQPEAAVAEIGALYDVYKDVARKYADQPNHLIVGDFNGSCSYASPAELDTLEIRAEPFTWVAPDKADTNLSPTSKCAYDRIVTNAELQSHYRRWGLPIGSATKRSRIIGRSGSPSGLTD